MAAKMLLPRGTLVTDPGTLDPLPDVLQKGLIAVSFFGFASFFLALGLLIKICIRLFQTRAHKRPRNQFLDLIGNLLVADIFQSQAFLLNTRWLYLNSIQAGSTACWTQGFFVSIGDLASGVFTLAIAVHTFADVLANYRPSRTAFMIWIISLWVFVFACAFIGIALHPHDFYMRAGAWCWVNSKYNLERLWLHYIWILVAEFGTVLIYSVLFIIINRRLKTSYYANDDMAVRARTAARAIIPYPVIYVVCTLPLALSRIESMTGRSPSFVQLCVSGAMITCNGWLDVLLYSLTRRALIFGPAVDKEDMRALDTFAWSKAGGDYGTTTTIQATPSSPSLLARPQKRRRGLRTFYAQRDASNSMEELVEAGIKTKTEVRVNTAPLGVLEMGDLGLSPRNESQRGIDQGSVSSPSFSTGKEGDKEHDFF